MLKLTLIFSTIFLASCGTFVPNTQSFVATHKRAIPSVQAIVLSIRCELGKSIKQVIKDDLDGAKRFGYRTSSWFDAWGVTIGLNLTIVESTDLSPTVKIIPSTIFDVSAGINYSTKATKKIGLKYTYGIRELYEAKGLCGNKKFLNKDGSYDPKGEYKSNTGSLLVHSNLKFEEAIQHLLIAAATGSITSPDESEALKYQITFQIVTGANATPAWKLTRYEVNKSGSLIKTSRDGTHDLLAVFGPLDRDGKLVPSAAATFNAAEIATAIRE